MDILQAGKIITLNPGSGSAEALVIDSGTIEFAGSIAEAERRYGHRSDIHRTNLGNVVVIPGFNDNHLHALSMGQFFASPRIAGMDSRTIVSYLTGVWANEPPGELLVARGWDYPSCPDPKLETLDTAFPDHPVVLIQFSGHGAWLNSRALALFGITHRTPDPEGGRIGRDEQGHPNGMLTDDAVRPIHFRRFRQAMKSFSSATPFLTEALKLFAQAGITSVQDNTWLPKAVGYYRKFRRQNRLTARFNCWSYGELWYGDPLFGLQRFDNDWVTRGAVKLFLDGTFSTRTALLLEPYPEADSSEAAQHGTASHSQDWLDNRIDHYAGRGRQVAAHAIGDGAVRSFIDAVERAVKKNPGVRDLRMRIEHAQLVHPDDINRLVDLGIVVSAQPHASVNPEKDLSILGVERARRAYPYRSLLDAGANLSFGSDVPGEESYSPLFGMQLAVNREGPEAITALEALRAYTVGGAFAEFAEGKKGMIKPGMVADLTVLDSDPLTVDPGKLSAIEVVKTISNGVVVYDRNLGYIPAGRAIADRVDGSAAIPSSAGGTKSDSQNPTA